MSHDDRSPVNNAAQHSSTDSSYTIEGVLMHLRNTFLDFNPPVTCSVPRAATMPNIAGLIGENDDVDFLADALRSFHPSVHEAFESGEETHTGSPDLAMLQQSPRSEAASLRAVASLSNMHSLLQAATSQSNLVGLVKSTSAVSLLSSSIDEDEQVFPPPPGSETTVMLRNLPNKLSQLDIIRCLEEKGFGGSFDFFYAPLDFKSRCNLGYAFINLCSPSEAVRLWHALKGNRLVSETAVVGPALKSSKTCEVSWARIQGLAANVKHYMHSPVNSLALEFRPMLVELGTGRLSPFQSPKTEVNHLPASRRKNQQPQADLQMYLGINSYVSPGFHDCRQEPNFNRKLFCGGLALETISQTLKDYMQQFGEVEEAVVLLNKETRFSRGFGFCTFRFPESAVKALACSFHWIDGVSVAIRPYSNH